MRGGSLTRFRPDDQSGGGIASDFKSLVKSSAQGGWKGGWKGLKTGGPWRLPNIPGRFRGAKRGAQRWAKRASLDIINREAKRRLNDIFGEWIPSIQDAWDVARFYDQVPAECIKAGCFYPDGQTELTIGGYRTLWDKLWVNERDIDDDDGHDPTCPLGGGQEHLPEHVQSTSYGSQHVFKALHQDQPVQCRDQPRDIPSGPARRFHRPERKLFWRELVVMKDNNTALAAVDVIGLANNLVHTIFKQINVRLNGTLISPQTDTYHLKAFIEATLNHDRDDGKTILAAEGWYNSLDVPDNGDGDEYTAIMLDNSTPHTNFVASSDEKKALVLGRLQFLGGGRVVMRFRPYLEVFHLSKLLIPGVQIQIDMYFNDPNLWTIWWDGARTMRLTQADVSVRLFLAQVRVAPSVHREITADLKSGKIATYPTVRGEIRTFSHPDDNWHFECNNSFHNPIGWW